MITKKVNLSEQDKTRTLFLNHAQKKEEEKDNTTYVDKVKSHLLDNS